MTDLVEKAGTLSMNSDLHKDDALKWDNNGSYKSINTHLYNSIYSEKELESLVGLVQRMTILYSLDHRDWNEKTVNVIRLWFLNPSKTMLTIFYDSNILTGCLGIPVAPVLDISYFMRSSSQIITIDTFHDYVNFGTIHNDVDGCLLRTLELAYAPVFRNHSEWDDNIKQRFCKGLDKFLVYLTGMHYKMSGMTVLYVPYIVRQIARENISYDPEFVKNLESIAVFWATQIRTHLNDKTLTVLNDFVILEDEYEFWLYRFEVLQALNTQLEQADVQSIIKILRNSHSVYIKQIYELMYECRYEMNRAMSNIKYLHLLMDPCGEINLMESTAFLTQVLPKLINFIRFIWLNSEQFNRRDLITGLFRDLSNRIIRFCTEMINLDKILSGSSRFGIKVCNLSLNCCLTYKGIYNFMAKETDECGQSLAWNLDNAMIFNHVDAFMERLNDLIDICESMIVFGRLDEAVSIPKPKFGGTNGPDFEKTTEAVEIQFLATLRTLNTDSKELILNVHKNDWYEEVLKYRRTVQSLDETVQRLMSNVFLHVCNVEEAIESLNVMLYYSNRSSLRKLYLRQVTEVWLLFCNEMDSTTLILINRSKLQENWNPFYALRAISHQINIERLTWIRGLFNSSEWLPNVSEALIVLNKFETIKTEFDKEMRKSYEDWQKNCCSNVLNQKLDRFLLARSNKRKGLLECNIDPSVLIICEQAQHFSRLGFSLIGPVRKIYEKYESLRFVYNSVLQVCLNYNHILSALSDHERKFFHSLIQACDRKIAPGVFKLSYGGDLSDAYIADCAKHTNKLQETMDLYKRANRNIATTCEKICNTPMLKFTFTGAVTISIFENHLSNYIRRASSVLRGYYNRIIDLLLAVFMKFQPVIEDMTTQWYNYVNVIDDMLATALLTSARNSLSMVCATLHRENDMAASPVVVMQSDIKDRRIELVPSMDNVDELIRGIIYRIESILQQFPRLCNKMKLPKEQQSNTFLKVFREDLDCIELIFNAKAEVIHQQEEIERYILFWNEHRALWETTDTIYIKRVKSTDLTADVFESFIKFYSTLADDISFIDAISHVYFILMNQNYIKNSVLDYIEKWQTLNIKILLSHSFYLIRGIYRYMRRNAQKIMMMPRTLKESLAAKEYFEQLIKDVPLKQSTFPGILDLFILIDKYQVEIPDDIRKQIDGLQLAWQEYLRKLGEADEMLDNNRDEFKKILLHQAEKFKMILIEFLNEFFIKLPTAANINPKVALKFLKILSLKVEDCFKFEESLKNDLSVFNVNQPENIDLQKLDKEVKIVQNIWLLILDWQTNWEHWRKDNFWKINIDEMEDKALSLYKEFSTLRKNYYDRNWNMLDVTTRCIDSFRRTLPLITALRNPNMRDRHWKRVRDVMQVDFDETSKKFTLELIINLDFQTFSEDIQDISNAATIELQIEKVIMNIAAIWKKQGFEMVHARDGVYRIKSVDECFQLLEEHIVQISAMKATPYVEPFIDIVDYWEKTLSYISETLEKALSVQRQWLYLENIFQGDDIRKQLPEEEKRFVAITDEFRTITSKMFEANTAVKSTHLRPPPFVLNRFNRMDEHLELIQRSLEIYLEAKRQLFPRFYFISNDDILEILGNSKRPDLVQTHLKKLFDNLYKLELRRVGKALSRWQATAMYSDDGECVEFLQVLYIDGPSERWLNQIEGYMITVMKEQLKLARASLKKLIGNREKWISMWPGQAVLTTVQIQFTTDCTRSLIHCKMVDQKKPLRKLKRKQIKVLMKLSEISRKDLPKIMRLKVNTIITLELHGRDVIERMYKSNCKDVNHFEWFSQLRFYWHRESELCVIKQTNTEQWYGYEYTGNSGRLVITPLTDRCYITLTTALHLNRGGSPKGPAGTGKTETVKDLGKALGLWVIVTNCSEGLDYKSIGKNFSGLAQSGCWGCFDEFNRINIEVLSVVAQQIMSIMAALSAKLKEFVFEGQTIKLISTVGLFITMNPGYAGRTELPDNLKSMFRPISMMVPDNFIIAENLLFSDGFSKTRNLARKVYTLYELAKQQLSKQYHYDFGLRSMVALLRYAGRKRRQLPYMNEEEIVFLAMKDMNAARLTSEDLPLFFGIMCDIFPDVIIAGIDYSHFNVAIYEEFIDNGLQPITIAVKKVIELFETKNSRHSVMIIGDTGTAKSVTWRTLQGAYCRMNAQRFQGWETVSVHPLNPKSLNLAELYGEYNLSTGEWLDGVLSSIMRFICSDEDPMQKWLLFDGPVDAIWIENMNSVMDDNKLLTLVNSERITMPTQVSLLFEVGDLAVASPATVSRCGMVYNDYNDWGWKPYVDSWLQKQRVKPFSDFLRIHFESILPKILEYKRFCCKEPVKTDELNGVMSLCKLLDGFSTKNNGIITNDLERLEEMTKLWFMFCLVWSVCATVDEESRLKLDAYIREIESCFPIKDTVYDYFVEPNERTFVNWGSKLSDTWHFDSSYPFYKIMVPTGDTIRHEYIIATLLAEEHPVMLVGNVGTGKTSTVINIMESFDSNKFCMLNVNISAQTTAAGLQAMIENRIEKRTKTQYVPFGGKKMICFMDDFNMPVKDAYGSQPPLELIRQWIDYKYWYSRKTQQKIIVMNTLLIAAMSPPGGGRQAISSRTQSRFVLLNITFPTHDTVTRIFGSMLKQKLEQFTNEVREMWLVLTESTVYFYNAIIRKMLPTPNKSHYLFNLRDISKVFQGLLRSCRELQTSRSLFLRLWVHEIFRVFNDRLVDDADQDWFINTINDTLGEYFEVTFHSLCPSKQCPLFGNFAHPQGFYEDLKLENLRLYMFDKLEEYNNFPGMSRMNLVFFKEAIEHVVRIIRVISQPRGHILNIGIGGSGRQVLAKLAAFILDMGIFKIEVSKKYKVSDLREDLKELYKLTGIKQRITAFIFSSEQVAEVSFLEIINNMLSSGEINLFRSDEFDELKSDLERPAKKAGIDLNTETLYSFFMLNVKDFMRIVLCFSPIGENFRNYIRQYPALLSASSPNWLRMWPQEALLEVASHFLKEFQLNIPVPGKEDKNDRESLVMTTEHILHRDIPLAFSAMHSSVSKMSQLMLLEVKRYNYVTSPNYLQLVSGFKELLELKRYEIASAANRLRNGLSKIANTQEKVTVMSEELKVSSEQVKLLAKECEEFISKIEIQKSEATEQKDIVDAEAVIIKHEERICLDLAAIARADLEVVLPMIDAAVKALDALNKKDIAEVKSYGRPPMKIEKVMEAVLILLGKEPTWENAKKVLSESTFLNDLKNFDRDHISERILKRIGLYTKNPELEPDKVAVVSVACKSLMLWIMAIENYGKVYRIVAPKQEKLDNAIKSLEEKQAALASAKKKLEELQAVIEELYIQLNEKTDLLNDLRAKEERLRKQLERAIILVESLSSERDRWIETVAQLDISFERLPGDCLLSTAFVTYLGTFDTKYREELLNKWRHLIKELLIPATADLKITVFLCDPVSIREWNIQGLPADDLSTENGVIVTQSIRWPLIIDPQMQANNWITKMEEHNQLIIIDLGMTDYLQQIEHSIKKGFPVLLQNVGETLDQAIYPILRRSFTIQSGEKLIKFNDKYITYNEMFRFYITTKISNPHYPPEVSSKMTVVNFALKKDGLEAQLLGIIVRKEKPALEEQKDDLVMTIARNQRTLIDLDNEILRLLNESRGSLLDDDKLFSTLQKSRQTSVLVKESLSIAEVTEVDIDAARREYKPASERAAILFFVLMDMSKIDPMYIFSLSAYIILFIQSIERSPRNQLVQERIHNIDEYHTYSVYRNTCRGLFEKHKLLFSIHMTAKILSNVGKLVEDEYDFILKGGIVLDKQGQPPNPAKWWISEQNWDNITELDKVPGFHGIIDSFETNFKSWNAWYASTFPEQEDLVGEWNDKLTDFQKICVVRSLRPDRVSFCLTQFIISKLGPRYVEPPVLDLKAAFDESLSQTPILFVLSPGIDPTQSLITLSETAKMSQRMFSLSLGQGQAPVATKLIMDGIKDGNWVFLANCHLSLSWMPTLDKMIAAMQSIKLHKKFRLWLSSSPHPTFPISILETSIKITTEPPRGIKSNMKRLYNNVNTANLEICRDSSKYKKLLFALCFFHTILLERKKFLQLGWNVVYSFNDSDFEVSEILLVLYLNEYEETPFSALKYLISGVNYGGHVTDDWDQRLLNTYINQLFNDQAIKSRRFRLSSLSNYFIPDDGDVQSYLDQIQMWPSYDKPEAFGQHSNADIASLIGETRMLFTTLLSMQYQNSSSENVDNTENKVSDLAKDILLNTPEEINYDQTVKIIGVIRTPLEVVLLQEIKRYNALLAEMREQLLNLRRGIQGLVVISADLEAIYTAVSEGRVPLQWIKAYNSLKPLASWARDLTFRVSYFNIWAKTLRPPTLFWLAAYTFPTGLLTAILQASARTSKTPIDELTWEFFVFVEEDANAARIIREGGGAYIHNLYLEGAGWQRKNQCLQDSLAMELICPLPVIHFKPVENSKKKSRGIFHCPCYYYPIRSGSFVITIDLKCGVEKADYWVKRGTAILLSLAN